MNQMLHNIQQKLLLTSLGMWLFMIHSPALAQGWLFTDYQYFIDEAESGGLHTGFIPSYTLYDQYYGPIHSNADIQLSDFGCPEFTDYVETAGSFDLNNCDSTIFWAEFKDSVEVIELPSVASINALKLATDYIYPADSKVNRSDITLRDTLIMTKIEFNTDGFVVSQWPYVLPPFTTDGLMNGTFQDTFYKYHNHTYGVDYTCSAEGFHHFDFYPPTEASDFYLPPTQVESDSAIIYVRGGQVLTQGNVSGKFTLITDYRTQYRAHSDNSIEDYVYNNIWLMDDLLYQDSDSTGYIQAGSSNSLGLISGANIIVANTIANGSQNSSNSSDIRINASMIALHSSFMSHYWQNSLTDFWQPSSIPSDSKGDGRGVNPFRQPTGPSDIRGTIMLHGSLAQHKRGLVKRLNPGPYNVSPGVGYEKDYHYDENLRHRIPPGFELLRDSIYTQESLSYFPIHIGDSWQYQVTPLEATGPELEHTEYFEVQGELQLMNGKTYFEILNHYSNNSEFVRIDSIFLKVYQYLLVNEDSLVSEVLLYNLNRPRYVHQPVQLYDSLYTLIHNLSAPVGDWGDLNHALDYYWNELPTFRLSSGVGLSYRLDRFASGDTSQLVYANIDGIEYGQFLVGIDAEAQPLVPAQFVVVNNYPNPFNPSTTIRYGLEQASDVNLIIYNVNGQMIQNLSFPIQTSGWSEFRWDGSNTSGENVSAGIYFCNIQAGEFTKTIKMVLVK